MSDMPAADAASSAVPRATGTAATSGSPATTAGGLLRQARQTQGLHIEALAAAIKVVPRKLELLESDQYSGLPDATFTRALAQAVCRHLKIDAAAVLALLPPPNGHRLEQVSEGLKTTFHERPGRFVPRDWASASSSALWLAVLLVVGAVVLYALPAGWLPATRGMLSHVGGASAPVASAASSAVEVLNPADVPKAPDAVVVESLAAPQGGESNVGAAAPGGMNPVAGVPALGNASAVIPAGVAGTAGAGASAAPVNAVGLLKLSSTAQSWVEVLDGNGRSMLGRLIVPGETVALDGPVPLKLRIGNASATAVNFNGHRVDLAPFTRDNVARLDLK